MPEQSNFEAILAESVSFLDAPQAADAPRGLLAIKATSALTDAIIDILKALGVQMQAYLPQLKVAVLAVYDAKIAPLDIVAIPNTFEPFFDALVRSALEKGMDALIAVAPTFAVSQAAAAAKLDELRASLPA